MKKVLLVLFLVLSLSLCSFSYADELVAPFVKVKQIVEEKGKEAELGFKVLAFEVGDKIIYFLAADNGNVGVIEKISQTAILVGYDAEAKVYFSVLLTLSGKETPILITEIEATDWGFKIFRILVEKGLI